MWLAALTLAIGALVGWALHTWEPGGDDPSWLLIAWTTVAGLGFVVLPLSWTTFSRASKPMRSIMSTLVLAGLARLVVGLDTSDCSAIVTTDVVVAAVLVAEVLLTRVVTRGPGRDRRAFTLLGAVLLVLAGDLVVERDRCSAADPSDWLSLLTLGAAVLFGFAIWIGRRDIGRVPRPGRLGARTVSIERFRRVADPAFALFAQHYANADRARFEAGLDDMQVAVVLEDELTGDLRGFSTLHLQARRDVSGRPCTIIFAGDTVIDRRSLGQGALQREWSRLLMRTKLRRPWRPLHWFLTCRDYRTYLLLVENVRTALPKFTITRPSPALATMLDFVAVDRFGDRFDAAAGVVHPDPDQPVDRGEQIPVITDELAQANPHVAFYLDRNPGYLDGDELVCIGDLTGRRVLQLWLTMTLRAPVRTRRALAARAADWTAGDDAD
ncbi:MAG: hypothetical protein JWN72_1915 [Thermoleophilia bacterium]|nr:hypothetical protein [Thermoleophilia bacterium]